MTEAFADPFADIASEYATFRPGYPAALFAYLASTSARHDLAWDCATGNGQAALGLAPLFRRVVATDASAAQITAARSHPRVAYRVAPAHASGLDAASVDLLTVAQALHWLDRDTFYVEAARVLTPAGVLAVWTYGAPHLDDAQLDRVLTRHYTVVVGPCWPPERRVVDDGYRSISFPFAELTAPPFEMAVSWPLAALLGYVRTWSASGRYRAEHGTDPTDALAAALAPLWGPAERRICWPLTLRLGRRCQATG